MEAISEPSSSSNHPFLLLPAEIHLLIASNLAHASRHALRLTHPHLYARIPDLPLTSLPPFYSDGPLIPKLPRFTLPNCSYQITKINTEDFVYALQSFGIYAGYRFCQICFHLFHVERSPLKVAESERYAGIHGSFRNFKVRVCGKCALDEVKVNDAYRASGMFDWGGERRAYCHCCQCVSQAEERWDWEERLCGDCCVFREQKRVEKRRAMGLVR